MPPTRKPTRLTLRTYQVGFGDCFLLTFHYQSFDRHVLIDFGSTGQPKSAGENLMLRVAEDIRKECGGKLHAVVATHRHKDHISGFATAKNKKGSGDIIAACRPDLVIQPWTEDPKAAPDTGALPETNGNSRKSFVASRQSFVAALNDMHAISEAVLVEAERRKSVLGKTLHRELTFLGDDNISNRSAVLNLMNMAPNKYLHYGSRSGLEKILPGVRIKVLGPPDLKQSQTIRKQRSADEAEFWHFQSRFWHLQAAAAEQFALGSKASVFPTAKTYSALAAPPYTRWFINRMRTMRGDQLLGIVRTLDKVMNNTSLILLFDVGGQKFLFPGDAQIENWSYALSKPSVRRMLQDVNLYKVGHHGSLNATPKSLWKLFKHRSPKRTPERLQTIVSTMPGKHGKTTNNTEVPRRPLVEALEAESDYFTTQKLKKAELKKTFQIDL
ncbi:MAG TPA: hypothetical protein VF656_18765 [Pyrinomonadaceae bacterium]|jgi:hypothetical protein